MQTIAHFTRGPEQADRISKHESVASVVEDTVHHLRTTRSWNLWEIVVSFFSEDNRHDVRVGYLDSENFRGCCVTDYEFKESNCNSKLTGSQYYHDGFLEQIGPPESFGTVYRWP
ncbi:hypothetical protein ACJW30_09G053000 [Castanea mollissima]